MTASNVYFETENERCNCRKLLYLQQWDCEINSNKTVKSISLIFMHRYLYRNFFTPPLWYNSMVCMCGGVCENILRTRCQKIKKYMCKVIH